MFLVLRPGGGLGVHQWNLLFGTFNEGYFDVSI